jgi:hypothetical protein
MTARLAAAASAFVLLASHARADVAWTISGCDVNLDCAFTLTGDPGPVTITLSAGTLDYIGASAAGYVTTPPIGNNGDGLGLRSTTLTGPRSGRLDIDGTPSFPGGSISFAGRSAPFVQSGTSWTARVTSTTPTDQRVTVSWTNATTNTDCSPLPAWNSTDPARLIETRVQIGRLAGGVFTSSGEVRVPMPASSVEVNVVGSLVDLAAQAQHVNGNGVLSAVAGPAQIGAAPTGVAPCVPPPPPVDCVVSAWTQGPLVPSTCPVSGVQTRIDSRTVLTPAANGGAACPTLTQTNTLTCVYVPPPPTNACELRPLTFSVSKWPAGITGARSLAYSSNKPIDRLDFGRSSTRINRVTATDSEGCTRTVTR